MKNLESNFQIQQGQNKAGQFWAKPVESDDRLILGARQNKISQFFARKFGLGVNSERARLQKAVVDVHNFALSRVNESQSPTQADELLGLVALVLVSEQALGGKFIYTSEEVIELAPNIMNMNDPEDRISKAREALTQLKKHANSDVLRVNMGQVGRFLATPYSGRYPRA